MIHSYVLQYFVGVGPLSSSGFREITVKAFSAEDAAFQGKLTMQNLDERRAELRLIKPLEDQTQEIPNRIESLQRGGIYVLSIPQMSREYFQEFESEIIAVEQRVGVQFVLLDNRIKLAKSA